MNDFEAMNRVVYKGTNSISIKEVVKAMRVINIGKCRPA